MPELDKLRVLSDLFGVDMHVLQYGGPSKTGEARQEWAAGLAAQDRVMVDGYLALPAAQRKLVRELVAALVGDGA